VVRNASWLATRKGATAGVVPAAVATLTEGVLKTMGVTKLAMSAVSFLVVVIGTVGVGVLAQSSKGPDVPRAVGDDDRAPSGVSDPQEERKFPSPSTHAIQGKLDEPVSFQIQQLPLLEAISVLRKLTGVDIVLDPRSLKAQDVTLSTPVSLNVSKVRLKTALKLLVRPLGLTYKVEPDVILITSPSGSLSATRAKTYYIGDLVLPPGKKYPSEAEGRAQIDMKTITRLIAATIAPGTWKDYNEDGELGPANSIDPGKPIGSITPFYLSGSLIIRHNDEVHDQISDLIRLIRRLPPLRQPTSATPEPGSGGEDRPRNTPPPATRSGPAVKDRQ